MTLVVDLPIDGPATHALVIGVGDYPHLLGGSAAQKARFDGGMGQLSSPPASARAFADWLRDRFNSPSRPLASLELLIGEAPQAAGEGAAEGAAAATLSETSIAQMQQAAVRWQGRARHKEDLLIFYFCGHGVAQGQMFNLVAGDFGADAGLPYSGLVDVALLLKGMSASPATDQCYFIDACRTATADFLDAEDYGQALVQKAGPPARELAQCVYYSTLGGGASHGDPGRLSLYTHALLQALGGAGAANTDGDWRINTVRLFEAMSHLMTTLPDPRLTHVQVPQSGSQVKFDLHHLVGLPLVPVVVQAEQHAGATPPPATIAVRKAQQIVARHPQGAPPPQAFEWRHRYFETWLDCGPISIEWAVAATEPEAHDHYLQPPGVRFKVRDPA